MNTGALINPSRLKSRGLGGPGKGLAPIHPQYFSGDRIIICFEWISIGMLTTISQQ